MIAKAMNTKIDVHDQRKCPNCENCIRNLREENKKLRKALCDCAQDRLYFQRCFEDRDAEMMKHVRQNDRLLVALADAIRSPLGVVKESANEFYNDSEGRIKTWKELEGEEL